MPGEAVCASFHIPARAIVAPLHSIPYWVSFESRHKQVSLPQMLSIQAVLFSLKFVSVIPLPGGAGGEKVDFVACLDLSRRLFTALSAAVSVFAAVISGLFLWIQNLRNSR